MCATHLSKEVLAGDDNLDRRVNQDTFRGSKPFVESDEITISCDIDLPFSFDALYSTASIKIQSNGCVRLAKAPSSSNAIRRDVSKRELAIAEAVEVAFVKRGQRNRSHTRCREALQETTATIALRLDLPSGFGAMNMVKAEREHLVTAGGLGATGMGVGFGYGLDVGFGTGMGVGFGYGLGVGFGTGMGVGLELVWA
jgi:hypothetical protein